MKTITYFLDGKVRSLMVPPESAAYVIIPSEDGQRVDIIIRMKKATEHSALTAFNNAVKESGHGLAWKQVSTSGWMETQGGIPDKLFPYMRASLALVGGQWGLVVDEEWDEFRMAQRDISALGARMPEKSRLKDLSELKKAMEMLARVRSPGK